MTMAAERAMHILAIEPYFGGSHQAFLKGWIAHSRHSFELLTMPPRKWKWRMRGAAVEFAEQVRALDQSWDLLFASDFLDLAAFAGMLPHLAAKTPLVAYFHENQLAYPVQVEDERDYQFAFTNLTTCLAADAVLFNSRFNMESFLSESADLLRRMPDEIPDWAPARIRAKARVQPVGVDLGAFDTAILAGAERSGPLRILWNHRWEHDKNPEAFFDVLFALEDAGCDFELAVIGERFRASPAVFERARQRLSDRIVAWGFQPSREEYVRVVANCDVVVSTAYHEFFGVSIVEAVYAGCLPLLPSRLSYPELLPDELHEHCLYADETNLKQRLCELAEEPDAARTFDGRSAMLRFGWDTVSPALDSHVADCCKRH